jgi:hypothetical protein
VNEETVAKGDNYPVASLLAIALILIRIGISSQAVPKMIPSVAGTPSQRCILSKVVRTPALVAFHQRDGTVEAPAPVIRTSSVRAKFGNMAESIAVLMTKIDQYLILIDQRNNVSKYAIIVDG